MRKLLPTIILLAAFPAFAGIRNIQSRYESCLETAGSIAEQRDCIVLANAEADAELNRVYKSLRTRLYEAKDSESKETLDRLVASQKAWIPYRDTDCKLAGALMLGGTDEPLLIGGCVVQRTVERVKQLENFSTE